MSRLAACFTFVNSLVNVPPPADGELRDGVDFLLALAGEQEGPAVILAALLQALGERVIVEYAPGMAFVRAELALEDLRRLPPYADLLIARGRFYLPLDVREARNPLGILPRLVRRALGASRRD